MAGARRASDAVVSGEVQTHVLMPILMDKD
jgi:hypothetical protein